MASDRSDEPPFSISHLSTHHLEHQTRRILLERSYLQEAQPLDQVQYASTQYLPLCLHCDGQTCSYSQRQAHRSRHFQYHRIQLHCIPEYARTLSWNRNLRKADGDLGWAECGVSGSPVACWATETLQGEGLRCVLHIGIHSLT